MKSCILPLLFMGTLTFTARAAGSGSLPVQDSSRTILYIFTGSDWCPNCRKFEHDVLKNSAFTAAMEANAVKLVFVDFPQRKKLDAATRRFNENIAGKYGFEGVFPTLVLCFGDPEAYTMLHYHNETAETFIKNILYALAGLRH